jgi:flagellar protein FliT
MVILNQVLQNEIILKELLQERMSELSGLIANQQAKNVTSPMVSFQATFYFPER